MADCGTERSGRTGTDGMPRVHMSHVHRAPECDAECTLCDYLTTYLTRPNLCSDDAAALHAAPMQHD